MLLRESLFRGAAFGHILDRQQDDSRIMRPARYECRVEQHRLAADPREHVIDVDVVQLRLRADSRPQQLAHELAQQLAQRRNVPLAVADREQDLADGVARVDAKRAEE